MANRSSWIARVAPSRRAQLWALGLIVLALGVAGASRQLGASEDAPRATSESEPLSPGDALSVAAPEQGPDLSIWGMFRAASGVAKSVMAVLVLASVLNLAILIEKSLVLWRVNRQSDRFLNVFRKTPSLEDLSRQGDTELPGPMARMFVASMEELHTTADRGVAIRGAWRERIRERMQHAMSIVQSQETRRLQTSMSLLATIGATAPFIGLFGTVWGIMSSFVGIAQSQATSLAVVAPGIAEALLATAVGLGAAIPAVMLYNKFSHDIGSFSARLDDFGMELVLVQSRELDAREEA